MGQKTNPNIFRLGVNKNWKTEFFEKKTKEFAYLTFVDLEIKSYIERFLNIHGLILHDYKIYHTNSVINIYISYAIKTDFKFTGIQLTETVKLVSRAQEQEFLYLNTKQKIKNNNNWPSKIQKYLKHNANYFKGINTNYKYVNQINALTTIERNNLNDLKIENKIQKFLKSIELFKNNKVVVNFKCINKTFNLTIKQKQFLRKKIMLLQKFKNTPFFKEGINLIFLSVSTNNSSKLLAKFIGIQLKTLKRYKFFMRFLKKTLTLFSNSSFSKIKGVRIKLKGRLNRGPRARHKILNIGDIPIQTIDSVVDYSESTMHNSKGSCGVKVWIVEKN